MPASWTPSPAPAESGGLSGNVAPAAPGRGPANTPRWVSVSARAKVNLHLRVLGMRDDGYHEIHTVVQTVDLVDRLHMERAEATKVDLEWDGDLDGPLPESPDIVAATVEAFGRAGGGLQGVEVRVVKKIPIGSGLAGGSADAAAVLMGLAEMTGQAVTDEVLREVAARAGCDVPFALRGGSALLTGRGDVVTPLDSSKQFWWVLGIPEGSLDTAGVYARYDELVDQEDQRALLPLGHPGEIEAALAEGAAETLAVHLHNDLERAACDMRPDLAGLKDKMFAAGATGTVMSGSGPVIAGLCGDRAHAGEVAGAVRGAFARVEVAPSMKQGAQIFGRGG